ncbi:MAG TPA: HlyD family efflux transporter periplasmic adaptor subunit [Alphaproteobacteria bacterium]|nr:HlyD family efflux transporter periplasmic adaptor subunit [Alphaproteobacteria bacterium]
MPKNSRVGLGALVLGAVALATWLLWRPTPPVPGVLEVNGRIEGDQAAVGPKIGGKIVRLAVREGDMLEAGALIAELASAQVREVRAAVEPAQAQVQSAEVGLLLAQTNVNDARVIVPFTGTILKKLVEPGEVVAAGTPLITLVDLAKLYAKVYVAEGDLGKVKVGDPARVYTDAFPKSSRVRDHPLLGRGGALPPPGAHVPGTPDRGGEPANPEGGGARRRHAGAGMPRALSRPAAPALGACPGASEPLRPPTACAGGGYGGGGTRDP